MRRDELYLGDIIEAADHIAEFLPGNDFGAFSNSELIRSAVVQKLAIIGEAAGRISHELRARYAQVQWSQIVAFRNILIHAYFGTDWNEVWKSATIDCPVLRKQVANILAECSGPAEESPGAPPKSG
ncbi:MAG TPA: DUF86 domain-containing protein [Terriglobales bacterium]|nr:DUF86 domain-containing protein [Terriglobales bacterium]